ncbi:hypothetical protein BH18CHL2_BH18CHL2_12230 [soil metagenome]
MQVHSTGVPRPERRFSAATALDSVRSGVALEALASERSMREIVAAVRDAKAGLRYGLAALDAAGLRRTAGLDPWNVAEVVGHALEVDVAAHTIARSLAVGRAPATSLPYDTRGPAGSSPEELLAGITAAEERAADALVLAAGGPTFRHRDLGELSARGWILFIAVHDAAHLHQAAAIVRTPR